jgi:hypothetical protein
MVECGVLFEVRAEFLNIIQTSFRFRGFKEISRNYERMNVKYNFRTRILRAPI